MKKVILIFVLGLLLSTNAYAVKLHKIKIGMSKMDFCNIFVWSTKNCANEQGVRYQKDNIEVQQAYDKFYVFNDVTRYIDKKKGGGKAFGNGTLYGIANNMNEAYKIIDEIKKNPKALTSQSTNTASSSSSSSSSSGLSTNDKIAQSKQICRDLGFKTNTEKFADCALKMMSMQFEASNKVASSSGGTTQKIIVKHQQDYDIADILFGLSRIVGDASSGSSTPTGSNCRIVQKAWGADMYCN